MRLGGEDAGGREGGVDFRMLGRFVFGMFGVADGEEVVFDGAGAVEPPAVARDALGELGFHGSIGREALDEGGGESVVRDAVFIDHGGYLAGEIVTAGAELLFGDHNGSRLRSSTAGGGGWLEGEDRKRLGCCSGWGLRGAEIFLRGVTAGLKIPRRLKARPTPGNSG